MVKPKVLIIEDDQYILKAMKLQFGSVGYQVKTAADGETALKILKRWLPSAVVLDILLPGQDGYQVLKTIKSSPQWQGMPVIIASNLNKAGDIDKATRLSAADYIVKSDLSLADLVMLTTKHINLSAHGRRSLR